MGGRSPVGGKYWLVTLNNGAKMKVRAKSAKAAEDQFKDSRNRSVKTVRDPDDVERDRRKRNR